MADFDSALVTGARTRVADLCKPIEDSHHRYDLVFSKFLCEHIADPAAFHRTASRCYARVDWRFIYSRRFTPRPSRCPI